MRRGDVENDDLGERDGSASQGDLQDLEAVAEFVVVRDERTDAGHRDIGDARDSRDAERGGDRRDGVHERAGDVRAAEPYLQHFDRSFDVQPRLQISLERGFTSAAASAASAAARRRRAQIVVALVARGHGADARFHRGAAEVEALCGNVAVELVKRRKRGDRHLGQLRAQEQARRVVLGGLGLAVEELAKDGERVERAREPPDEGTRALRCVAPSEASIEATQHGGKRRDGGCQLDWQDVLFESFRHQQRQSPVRSREARERASGRPRGERLGNEHRASARVRAHVLAQHRPEEESDICVRTEHAELRQRGRCHARLPRAGPVRTARRVVVPFERRLCIA